MDKETHRWLGLVLLVACSDKLHQLVHQQMQHPQTHPHKEQNIIYCISVEHESFSVSSFLKQCSITIIYVRVTLQ